MTFYVEYHVSKIILPLLFQLNLPAGNDDRFYCSIVKVVLGTTDVHDF